MAAAEKVKFPTIPTAHWFALRKKFQQTIPGVVTANYIASVLKMQEDSARANVLPGLVATKIIDDEGKTQERARRWRDDGQYAAVCKEILQDCYPGELLDAFPEPAKDREGVSRWFANHTGSGAASVYKLVSFYLLLWEADPSKAPAESKPEKAKAEFTKPRPAKAAVVPARVEHQPAVTEQPARQPKNDVGSNSGPAVHINLQVHISADASTDQIDQVFASMAKHIYKKASE